MTQTNQSIVDTLRQSGFRMTPQRILILEVMAAHEGHVTAEFIQTETSKTYPGMSLSTVYRTLETFQDFGLVTAVDTGDGPAQYHFSPQAHHHHLICRKCGTNVELEDTLFEPLSAVIHERYGFHAKMNHFAIVGICVKCTDEVTDEHGHAHAVDGVR